MNKALKQKLLKMIVVTAVGISGLSIMAADITNMIPKSNTEVADKIENEQTVIEESESNNTVETANVIDVNTTIIGKLGMKDSKGEKDREDYFKIVLAEPGLLEITFERPADMNSTIKLFGQNGEKKIAAATGTEQILQMNQRLEAGTYYIRLNAGTGAGGEYKLTTTFTEKASTMDVESNDLFSDALKYQIGKKVTGHIGYVNDLGLIDKEDWYKVTLAKEANIKLSLTPSNDVSLFLKLYDNSKQLKSVSGKNKDITLDTVLKPGTYYIAVKRSVGAGEYTLTSTIKQNK